MILLIEPDKAIKKKLCDLLSRERIIGVNLTSEALEMLCKFKGNIDIIIANIHILRELLAHQIIFRLCQRLAIEAPPIIGFYKKGDEKIKEDFEQCYKQCKLIEYNENDYSFPGQYIGAIREVYPELNADIEQAREVWLKEKEVEVFVDPGKWLEEEGFLEIVEKTKSEQSKKDTGDIIISIEEILVKNMAEEPEQKKEVAKAGYEKLYFELKKKYDELLRYVKELIDSIKNLDG